MTDWRSIIQPERIIRSGLLDGDVHGCQHCGLPEVKHPVAVYGLGHFSTAEDVPKHFVAPTAGLIAERTAARQSHGLPIAEVDELTGHARTHLVRAQCPCGADAVCTPERVEGARCGACMLTDAGERVARPGYDMRARMNVPRIRAT